MESISGALTGMEQKMNYYFKSPFLEKQDWAVFKSDGLSPIVTAAHKKGLGVIINMEGVNPYHWEKNKWTPENIKTVANDLAADSVDGVFEECFEVSPEVFKSLAQNSEARMSNIFPEQIRCYSGNLILRHCGRKQQL